MMNPRDVLDFLNFLRKRVGGPRRRARGRRRARSTQVGIGGIGELDQQVPAIVSLVVILGVIQATDEGFLNRVCIGSGDVASHEGRECLGTKKEIWTVESL